MTDVTPLSKEAQVSRSPGGNRYCEETGVRLLRRECQGPSCRGRRNRNKGKTGQRAAREALRLSRERWVGREANEETWTAAVRVEVKAGGSMANPIQLRYDKMRAQSDAATAIGDTRPFVGVVKADGHSDVIVMVKGADLPNVVQALLEEWS